jgi:hypothetical protein
MSSESLGKMSQPTPQLEPVITCGFCFASPMEVSDDSLCQWTTRDLPVNWHLPETPVRQMEE